MSEHRTVRNVEDMLDSLFTESVACEVALHDETPLFHQGEGEWYITIHCGTCDKRSTTLVCDRFRNMILQFKDTRVACEYCRNAMTIGESISSMVRRG